MPNQIMQVLKDEPPLYYYTHTQTNIEEIYPIKELISRVSSDSLKWDTCYRVCRMNEYAKDIK